MNRKKQGIVLITTMLLLSFIIMIAALLIVTGKNTLLLGASYNDREKAQYAAECGLSYVQYCISKNPDWTASEGTTINAIYNPGFENFTIETVTQDTLPTRCVHGRLTRDGAEFYIAFWDGSTFNTRKDEAGYVLKYYSANNLLGTTDSTSQYYYSSSSRAFKTVPAGYAHIIVEGRCNTARKYTEAILTLRDSVTGLSCSMAAGNVTMNLTDSSSVFLVNTSGTQDSKIRAMGDISVNSVTGDMNPYQIANSGTSYTGDSTGTRNTLINSTAITDSNNSDYGINYNTDDQTSYLKKARISWEKAAGDYVSGTGYNTGKVTTTIKGGTYVYRQAGAGSSTYNLYYYDTALTSANAKTFVNNNTGTLYTDNPTVTGSGLTLKTSVTKTELAAAGNYLITATGPAGITDTGTSNSFCTAVYDYNSTTGTYLPSTTYRSSVLLDGSESALVTANSSGSTSGNIYVDGELSGTGKIISAGTLTFQGHSVLQAANNSGGLSVYACGNIQVDPVKGDSSSTSDVNSALSTAWSTLTDTLTASGDEYDSGTTSYSELRNTLLETTISWSGSTARLIDVLTGSSFNYDADTANNLVDTLLAKNTYQGNNNSTTTSTYSHAEEEQQHVLGTLYAWGSGASSGYSYNGGNTLSFGPSGMSNALQISFANVTTTGDYDLSTFTSIGGMTNGVTIDNLDVTGITVTDATNHTGHVTFNYNNHSYTATIGSDGSWTMDSTTTTTGSSTNIMMYSLTGGDYTPLVFNDTTLKGLIYTWGDLYGPDLQGGSFAIRGGIVAYGGDPSSDDPGANSKGRISMNNAKTIIFTYDPSYMSMLLGAGGCSTKRIFQANF